jgi:nucleolar protein 14
MALISISLDALYQFSSLYQYDIAFPELFSPLNSLLKHMLESSFFIPEMLRNRLQTFYEHCNAHMTSIFQSRQPLCLQKHRALPLRTLEPYFEEDYSLDRKTNKSRSTAQNEHRKLVHVHRREFKGAVRELRKDAHFLAHHRLQKQLEHDKTYREHIRNVTHNLELQQSEMNATTKRRKK